MIDLADTVEGLGLLSVGLAAVGQSWASPTLLWLAIGAGMMTFAAIEKRTGWLSDLL